VTSTVEPDSVVDVGPPAPPRAVVVVTIVPVVVVLGRGRGRGIGAVLEA